MNEDDRQFVPCHNCGNREIMMVLMVPVMEWGELKRGYQGYCPRCSNTGPARLDKDAAGMEWNAENVVSRGDKK